MKNLVLFGMQGAGKGTQARLLAEKFDFHIFETGAELRKLTQEDSELGRKVREIIGRGDLVPNEIVMEIIAHFVEETAQDTPILFDGIPRSLSQKETFDALLAAHERPLFALFIDISEAEAMQRLLLRKRADDTEAVIRKRIENYRKETLPVIEAYEQEGLLRRINGLQSIEGVFEEAAAIVAQSL